MTNLVLLSVIFGGLFIGLSFGLLSWAEKNLPQMDSFEITSIETADSENLSFMLLYLLPLFENQISTLNWPVTFIAMGIYAWVIWAGYGFHFNPLLSIRGWHYYKAGTPEGVTYILISKQQFTTISDKLVVKQLTEYILLDVGGQKS